MAHHEIDIEEAISRCVNRVATGLRERVGGGERRFQARAQSCTIFRIPEGRRGINPAAEEPELVSLGPYYGGHDHLREFEEQKWYFLRSFLHRDNLDVGSLIRAVAHEARSAWDCYSEPQTGFDGNFMEMMLLDGCFVVELLLQICGEEDARAPILRRRGVIPILIRDLLKLENQVPYSLLQSLFLRSMPAMIEARTSFLCVLALRVLDLVYPELRRTGTNLQYRNYPSISMGQYNHLLHLFYSAIFLANPVPHDVVSPYRPSGKSIPCVTKLRSCGIKFKSKKTERFLDISFRKQVLEIPSITIDDFVITVLRNCIALEQCQESIAPEQREESSSKYVTDYVSFMQCLIKHPEDSSLLCSDGIMSTLSHDDPFVVKFFDDLGKGIVFNVNNCYLSNQFKELESYYSSNRAYIIRTYFSSPWAAIAAFSAFLTIALALTQTVYVVLGHHFR